MVAAAKGTRARVSGRCSAAASLLGVLLGCLCTSRGTAEGAQQEAPAFDPLVVMDTVLPRFVQCYAHARYLIVERELEGALGADVYVRPRASGRCDADSLPGDLVVRNARAEYFAGIRDDVLFLDSGTGPDLRGLILVDIRTGRRILERSYVEVEAGPAEHTVNVWDGYYLDAPMEGCDPPTGGLQAGVDSLFTMDLPAGTVAFAGRTRCAVRQ